MKRYSAVSLLFAGLLALAAMLSARAATTDVFSESLDLIYAAYPDRVTNNRLFPVKIVAGITGRF